MGNTIFATLKATKKIIEILLWMERLSIYLSIYASICRMDPLLLPWAKPLQHVSTLVRQFLVDLIFVVENSILLGIALNSNIIELRVTMDISNLVFFCVRKLFTNVNSFGIGN